MIEKFIVCMMLDVTVKEKTQVDTKIFVKMIKPYIICYVFFMFFLI